jgi:hypothetical protein
VVEGELTARSAEDGVEGVLGPRDLEQGDGNSGKSETVAHVPREARLHDVVAPALHEQRRRQPGAHVGGRGGREVLGRPLRRRAAEEGAQDRPHVERVGRRRIGVSSDEVDGTVVAHYGPRPRQVGRSPGSVSGEQREVAAG